MEQVKGGDLVVNRGDESKPKEDGSGVRELNAVEGYEAALKLSEVSSRLAIPAQNSSESSFR
jgi:hypothetical protein